MTRFLTLTTPTCVALDSEQLAGQVVSGLHVVGGKLDSLVFVNVLTHHVIVGDLHTEAGAGYVVCRPQHHRVKEWPPSLSAGRTR